MIRRFNHTSRKSIRGAHARVTLRRLEQNVPRPRRKGADDTSNETWCFDLKLDLDRFGFPADARLRIDAWRGTASQRWDWGTVGTQAAPPERDRILTDVPKTSQFRVSVVAAGDSGRLLGVADKLRPRLPVESLLPLQRADLGDEVWRLDYGQGDDIVVLQVNRRPNQLRPACSYGSRVPGTGHATGVTVGLGTGATRRTRRSPRSARALVAVVRPREEFSAGSKAAVRALRRPG